MQKIAHLGTIEAAESLYEEHDAEGKRAAVNYQRETDKVLPIDIKLRIAELKCCVFCRPFDHVDAFSIKRAKKARLEKDEKSSSKSGKDTSSVDLSSSYG